MSSARIAEIRARLAVATPGPWLEDGREVRSADPYLRLVDCVYEWADRDLIAHAPADLEYLLGRLAKVEALIRLISESHRHDPDELCSSLTELLARLHAEGRL